MKYLASARKWRPTKFDEMIGQEHISFTLKNAIKTNRISHAYLFAGPRGVGKTTAARIFAKAVNCLDPQDYEPCNKCENCLAIINNQTLDVIEIDGASNRKIEDIRALRESVRYAPTTGKYKVYIIDEVHMLTNESFNALLKTLEEPPEFSIFIFATTDVHKVPVTIISRCQRFDFRRIEVNTIKKHLAYIAQKEGINIDDKSLTIIAKKADGALRDSLSIFDQAAAFCGQEIKYERLSEMLNLIDEDIYFEISEAIDSKNFKAAYEIVSRIYNNGWNYVDFVNGLIEHFNNYMILLATNSADMLEISENDKQKYLISKGKFSISDCLRILNFLQRLNYELKNSQNPKVKLEVSLCHLIGFQKTSFISDIVSQLNKASESGIEIKINPDLVESSKSLSELQNRNDSSQNITGLANYPSKEEKKLINTIDVSKIQKSDSGVSQIENIYKKESERNILISDQQASTIDYQNNANKIVDKPSVEIEERIKTIIASYLKSKNAEINFNHIEKKIELTLTKASKQKLDLLKSSIEEEIEKNLKENYKIEAIEKEIKRKVKIEMLSNESGQTESEFIKKLKEKLNAKEIK